MKRKWIIAAACAVLLSGMEAMACTGLLVGKKASVDGSVMISYAADSHTLYGELYRWPAATWPKGAMLEVREWDTNKPLGQIPQVEQTYSVVGNMNEHQVAITESTWGGRPELVDTTGIIRSSICFMLSCFLSVSGRPLRFPAFKVGPRSNQSNDRPGEGLRLLQQRRDFLYRRQERSMGDGTDR